MLSNTKLAAWIAPRRLAKLEKLGEVCYIAPDEVLYQENAPSEYLYVILEGDVELVRTNAHVMKSWRGQGDLIGEIGFVLGTRRFETTKGGMGGCKLWRLHRAVFFHSADRKKAAFLTHLIHALVPHILFRLETLTRPRTADPDLARRHCDYRHASIRRLAAYFRKPDPWQTATRIWEYVRNMPYRFGPWQMRASRTLHLGYGMCTTKANLQVALLRANQIEGGFAELVVTPKYVSALLPPGYRNRIGRTIKHYFAVVKLDGKWFPCDASFTLESLQLMAREVPSVLPCLGQRFQPGEPFNPVGEGIGLEPFDFVRHDSLEKIMLKKPYYDDMNFEAMNALLDRVQGPVADRPGWVTQSMKLLAIDPEQAFQAALAGLIAETTKLYAALMKNDGKGKHSRLPHEKTAR